MLAYSGQYGETARKLDTWLAYEDDDYEAGRRSNAPVTTRAYRAELHGQVRAKDARLVELGSAAYLEKMG